MARVQAKRIVDANVCGVTVTNNGDKGILMRAGTASTVTARFRVDERKSICKAVQKRVIHTICVLTVHIDRMLTAVGTVDTSWRCAHGAGIVAPTGQ